jgi:hypothetical protein
MKSDINNDLSKLNEWAKLWLVDFNPKKTKALVISTSAVPHLDLRFNGEPVEIVKTHHQQISVLDYPSCLLYRLCRVEKEEVQVPIFGEHQL